MVHIYYLGIIAAKQLRYLGFQVTVIEAMERLGGRICTFRFFKFFTFMFSNFFGLKFSVSEKKFRRGDGSTPWHAEMGAMVIIGLPGNPLHTLSKEILQIHSRSRGVILGHTG